MVQMDCDEVLHQLWTLERITLGLHVNRPERGEPCFNIEHIICVHESSRGFISSMLEPCKWRLFQRGFVESYRTRPIESSLGPHKIEQGCFTR